jgi:hypothetical protein
MLTPRHIPLKSALLAPPGGNMPYSPFSLTGPEAAHVDLVLIHPGFHLFLSEQPWLRNGRAIDTQTLHEEKQKPALLILRQSFDRNFDFGQCTHCHEAIIPGGLSQARAKYQSDSRIKCAPPALRWRRVPPHPRGASLKSRIRRKNCSRSYRTMVSSTNPHTIASAASTSSPVARIASGTCST